MGLSGCIIFYGVQYSGNLMEVKNTLKMKSERFSKSHKKIPKIPRNKKRCGLRSKNSNTDLLQLISTPFEIIYDYLMIRRIGTDI